MSKCKCGGSFDEHDLCFECDSPKPKYSKPGDTHWKRMGPYLEPFTDKAEAVRFMESLRAKSGIVERFLRGGFRGSLGGQLLHDDEHKAVCDHIKYLEAQLEAK